jgi:hypothetical protein
MQLDHLAAAPNRMAASPERKKGRPLLDDPLLRLVKEAYFFISSL